MPNSKHKWTLEEEKAAVELDWDEFNARFNGPAGLDISKDAYRIRRNKLRRGAIDEMAPDLIKVPGKPVGAGPEGYVGPMMAFFDIETTYSSQPRVLYANITDSWGRPEQFSLYDPQYQGEDWLDDSLLVSAYARRLEEYDEVVSWNGKLFDIPVLNARLNYHRVRFEREGKFPKGLRRRDFLPVEPSKHIDLMYYASGQFNRLGRRSLESVSTYFDSPNRKTPLNVKIWDRADHGDRDAYALIEEHCDLDNLVLRDVYDILKIHVRNVHR